MASAPQRRMTSHVIAPLGGAGTGLNPFARGGMREAPVPIEVDYDGGAVGGGDDHDGGGEYEAPAQDVDAGDSAMVDTSRVTEELDEAPAPRAAPVLRVAASVRRVADAAAAPAVAAPAPLQKKASPLSVAELSGATDAAASARALNAAASAPVSALGALDNAPGAAGTSKRALTFDRIKNRKDEVAETCLFYWLDVYEDQWKAPGILHVFGKVLANESAVLGALRHNDRVRALKEQRAEKELAAAAAPPGASASTAKGAEDDDESELVQGSTLPAIVPVPAGEYVSACVTISGFNRVMFVLPREHNTHTGEAVEPMDVYNEFTSRLKSVIPAGKGSFGMKKVSRSYAFELAGVPRESSDYMKLKYSATFPALPADISGATFSRIFGAATTSTEHFLLKRRLKGPCWLRLVGVKNNAAPVSHCAVDLTVDDPKGVCVYGSIHPKREKGQAAISSSVSALRSASERAVIGEWPLAVPPPELVVVSLSLKTQVAPRGHSHEIVAAALVVHSHVSLDGASVEDRSATQTLALLRPIGSTGLPPSFRSLIAKEPNIKAMHDERALLNVLLAHIERIDPDVLCGHNISGFDLDVLLHRLGANKISTWSRIGRLRRSQMPRTASGVGGREQFTGVVAAGRLICDTYLAARELLLKETTYTLSALSRGHLRVERTDIDPLDVPRYMTTGEDCVKLARHTDNDAWLAMRLMFRLQVLPLTKQLTNLAGNLWSRSLKGARAERIEYLLLHEFHRTSVPPYTKFIVPDKAGWSENKKAVEDEEGASDDEGAGRKGKRTATGSGTAARAAKGRSKPAYAGGLVLEPKKGLYDKFVLLLDFNSLYPSIIQEYNICFTTVDRPLKDSSGAPAPSTTKKVAKKAGSKRKSGEGAADGEGDTEAPPPPDEDADDDDGEDAFVLPPLPDEARHPEPGVLPRVIRHLVQERRKVKSQEKSERDPAKKASLDIRQKALKILANSMYGCLGFSSSRFYAKPIAALVTSQGREILQNTVNMARDKFNLEVIYGDTDSVMIHTNSVDIAAVRDMGRSLISAVNKLYKHLEIDIDGIFSHMLLLKKKKYAALKLNVGPGDIVSETREVKGLDMVRRDWCVLSKKLGETVLDIILASKRSKDEVVDGASTDAHAPNTRPWTPPSRLPPPAPPAPRTFIPTDLHSTLADVAKRAREGMIPIESFVITKGLNKSPHDYPDVKGQPHLQVALTMLKQGKTVNVGDHIPYVICTQAAGSVDLGVSASPVSLGAGSPPPPSSYSPAVPPSTAASGHSPEPATVSPIPIPLSEPPASASPGSPPQFEASPSDDAAAKHAAAVERNAAAAGGGGAGGSSSKVVATPAAQRAWHPEDFKKAGGRLTIDVEWYLSQQVRCPCACTRPLRLPLFHPSLLHLIRHRSCRPSPVCVK